MALAIAARQVGSVAVVDVTGRLVFGEECGIVREKIRELLASGQKNILLNLSEVTYADSAGLGELVASHVTVAKAGGTLKILNSQKKLDGLLELTRLHTIFEVFADQDRAVLSF